MIVRICAETGCRTRLSHYNSTTYCWNHRRSTRRIEDELAGNLVQRGDEWLINHRHAKVETWRPHMMSETFVAGLERQALSPTERKRYADGSWLLPPDEEATIR